MAFSVTTRESYSIKLSLLNLYWSAGEPIVVRERTTIGLHYEPLLVRLLTSSGSYHPLIVLRRARCGRRGKVSAPVGRWTTGWGASLGGEKGATSRE